ncbi:MAG: hypothetical protein KDD60_02200, partial [Bdellovibrionales bacterium]|nr:hypothetical protein [Bdellovibrionales bacterium]
METSNSYASTIPPISRLRAFHGIVLALVSAFTAEIVLGALQPDSGPQFATAGRIALTFLSIYTLHRFALTSLSDYTPRFRDLLCLLSILIGSLALVWIGRILSRGLAQYLTSSNISILLGPDTFEFAIPYASGALLLQAVLGLHYGLFYAISLSLIMGVYTPSLLPEVPYVLSTSLMACL